MDLSGLNVPRLKQNVLEKWQSAPELWPAKVISLAGVAKLEAKHGGKKLATFPLKIRKAGKGAICREKMTRTCDVEGVIAEDGR